MMRSFIDMDDRSNGNGGEMSKACWLHEISNTERGQADASSESGYRRISEILMETGSVLADQNRFWDHQFDRSRIYVKEFHGC